MEFRYVLEGRSLPNLPKVRAHGLATAKGPTTRSATLELGPCTTERRRKREEKRKEEETNERKREREREERRSVGKATVIMDEKTRRGRVEASQGKSNTMEPSRELGPEANRERERERQRERERDRERSQNETGKHVDGDACERGRKRE